MTARDGTATKPREIRQRLGVPLIRIAAEARVSEHLARIYEIDPREVKDEAKRARLASLYAGLAAEASALVGHASSQRSA